MLCLGGLLSITTAFGMSSKTASASLVINIFALTPVVFATPVDLPTHNVPRYPIVPLRRRITIDGREIELTGTDEEQEAELLSRFPDSNLTSLSYNPDGEQKRAELKKRAKANANCCRNMPSRTWKGADTDKARECVGHQLSFYGSCYVNGLSCTRLRCLRGVGLFLCNDNHYEIHPNCDFMGTYGDSLIAQCTWATGGGTCGQMFDTDGYNIILKDGCDLEGVPDVVNGGSGW
ncbi:hypothetical protein HYALB_00007079 [Hymenoscyphus albidus]|uniref:Cyanovirin-N domain-containing protein n=1 Tax=Hymenoscyphus albidus TaxID=595503 RepID=A0A9N9LLI9_9HELO|nr:hypothetical protein HYALB_00007079 [Hymenoscyphus albidus]